MQMDIKKGFCYESLKIVNLADGDRSIRAEKTVKFEMSSFYRAIPLPAGETTQAAILVLKSVYGERYLAFIAMRDLESGTARLYSARLEAHPTLSAAFKDAQEMSVTLNKKRVIDSVRAKQDRRDLISAVDKLPQIFKTNRNRN